MVCNGCTDDTAAVVSSYPPPVRLIDTPVGGKAHAIDLGRRSTAPGVRVYLDADVVISGGALRAVDRLLADPAIHGAAPAIELVVPEAASFAVRHYASVWRQAPYFGRNLIGAGFFALDAEADGRIGEWPDLIADDLVALCHLDPDERAVAPTETFRHELPPTIGQIWRAEVRREAGRRQFAAWAATEAPDIAEEETGGRWLIGLARRPRSWIGLGLFVAVKATAKVQARRDLGRGHVRWAGPR